MVLHISQTLAGGYEFDGGTDISPVNTQQLQQATDQALQENYSELVVSGVFSPVNSSQEESAARIIQQHAALQHAGECYTQSSCISTAYMYSMPLRCLKSTSIHSFKKKHGPAISSTGSSGSGCSSHLPCQWSC